MALQLGFDLIRESFTQTTVFGVNWFIALAVTFLAMAIIAGKNWNDYKTLLLPVTVCVHVLGLTPSLLQYILGAIMLVMETLSLEMLGNIAETATNITKRTTESVGMITSRIYDRDTYKAIKDKYKEKQKESYTDRLSKILTKKQLTGEFKKEVIGTDDKGKPILRITPKYADAVDEISLEKARIQGLGRTIREGKKLSETRKRIMDMERLKEAQIKARKGIWQKLPSVKPTPNLKERKIIQKRREIQERKHIQSLLANNINLPKAKTREIAKELTKHFKELAKTESILNPKTRKGLTSTEKWKLLEKQLKEGEEGQLKKRIKKYLKM